jgi:hypothetical protein
MPNLPKIPNLGMSALFLSGKKVMELFNGSKKKKTSLVMRDCLTSQVRQQIIHHEHTSNRSTKAKHQPSSIKCNRTTRYYRYGGGDEYTQVTLDVTSCEVPFSLGEANSASPPFSRGQLVRIVKGRASRRKYQGKFGEVASVVRGSEDENWTIYVLLPGNPLAIALLPKELELINIDSLVGGAA